MQKSTVELHKTSTAALGLCVQTDKEGLQFEDLGPIFQANVSNDKAETTVEICGFSVIKDGYFYLYARDVLEKGKIKQCNLSVARAKVSDVVRAGLKGKNAKMEEVLQR